MKTWAWLAAALGLFALACANATQPGNSGVGSAESSPTGSTSSSGAAALRTHLDLLAGEQVMIVAKETAAAADHEDAYAGYTALLTSNLADLTEIVRTAFGSTAADGFSKDWSDQNGFLVDYGIGAVTHNDAKAQAAMSNLETTSVPKLAGQIADMSGLSGHSITQLLTQQVGDDKAFMDDLAAQKYSSSYDDLRTAYFASERLGDALSERMAQRFPDRFPGDPTLPAVDQRVMLNILFQEHAYLATMATDAAVGARDADQAAATAALGVNQSALSRSMTDLYGSGAKAGFDAAWQARDAALIAYAQKGDSASRSVLTATAPPVASAARAPAAVVSDELAALIKVIDDQRAKASDKVAGDDRAAATSMQPVADAIVPGPTI